jgi:hypothetical protein
MTAGASRITGAARSHVRLMRMIAGVPDYSGTLFSFHADSV